METQRQYQLQRAGDGAADLTLVAAPVRPPGPNEILVRVRAVSLNRRDVYVRLGLYPGPKPPTLVPLSDGAGEVIATGPGVSRVAAGDRVAAIFFQRWLDGRPRPDYMASALGGAIDGMLSEYVTLHEDGVVKIPAGLSFEEAATLPCAGVTAWNALVTRGRTQPGDHVLLLGTGGVSMFGLQLAIALGAQPVVTSSSAAKLVRARELGAVATIDTSATPDWPAAVRAVTGGAGVQQALEVGGVGTLPKTLASLSFGGHVALIGGLAGFGGDIPSMALMGTNATASGIYVGSRADFAALLAFQEKRPIRPVIDRVFAFDEAAAAYQYLDSGGLFGKVVIRL
ncbi:MAG TPA: NAD(P)-dependent alcohol dehydrogenase [Steroidobacteraceae bacterium]|nr:NAD(P)-dependent alcohol dehydrogenase [Steroidobacteraceae bacterium]